MHSTLKNISNKKPTINSDAVCNKYLQYPDKTGKTKAEGGLRLAGKYKQSLKDKPLITVITVVYNNEETLERCIKSVLEQTYDNIEYIVIDGGSNDGTLDIINKYQDSIDYFISEPDGGIYYAMNKAISLATGDYLSFMNSDDWFSKIEIINQIIPYINNDRDNIVYGKIMYYRDDTPLHESSHLANDKNILIGHPIPHQAAFITKKSFNIVGDYDTSFTLAADYDWWVKAKKENINFSNTKYVIANFTSGGANHQSFLLGQMEYVISLYNNKIEIPNKPLRTDKFSNTLNQTNRQELKYVLNKIPHNYNIDLLLRNLLVPKISIIIPVYNASKYLRKCLSSIINQTFKKIEIIIVNDCSPDPLDDEICKDYANKDDRIIYIKHTQNKRQGGARNTALNIARGEYLWFVDADDFIDLNACEYLYNTVNKMQVDVLAFSANSYHIKEGKAILDYTGGYYAYERNKQLYSQKLNGNEFLKLFQGFVAPWQYLFSRALFHNFRFREKVFHEDTDLIPIVLFHAKQIGTVKYSPYFRLLHNESVTQSKWTKSRLIDNFLSLESLLNYIQSNDFTKKSSLQTVCQNQYNYTMNELLPNININSEKISQHIEHLESLFNNICSEPTEDPSQVLKMKKVEKASSHLYQPSITQQQLKVEQILKDKWYRFGQMSRKRKFWTIGKVLSKKVKLYWLLQPIAQKFTSGKNYEK